MGILFKISNIPKILVSSLEKQWNGSQILLNSPLIYGNKKILVYKEIFFSLTYKAWVKVN